MPKPQTQAAANHQQKEASTSTSSLSTQQSLPNPFTPLTPFEPVSADSAPEGENWIAQIKWDGVRMLTYYDGREVRLFNRKHNERTLQYPEYGDIAAYCSARQCILDGEIIALENGKPSFHRVMKRDGLRTGSAIKAAIGAVPVTYMLFDVLFHNGEWVTGRKLADRQRLLAELIAPNERVQLVQSFSKAGELFRAVQAHGMEGIVSKDLDSSYAIGGKDGRWRKTKNIRDVIAVVGGVTFRDRVVNALLLGLYDRNGQLVYIGHAGTGKLSQSDWRELTETVKPLIVDTMPFVNRPERGKDAVWLQPALTAKIQFLEWTANGTLRQPSIQAFTAKPATECTFLDESVPAGSQP